MPIPDILLAILEMFGFFAIGWLARHLKYIGDNELRRWSAFIIDFLFPLLIFHSIVTDFDPARLPEVWPLPVLGLAIMVLGAALGYGLRRGVKSRDPDIVRTFHHFCAVNNWGFLPLIIVDSLWGGSMMVLLFFMNLGSRAGYWTVGVGLLGKPDPRQTLKNIFSAPLVALLVAVGLAYAGFGEWMRAGAAESSPEALYRIAVVLMDIAGQAGRASIAVMLIIVGASMYRVPLLDGKRDLAYVTVMRLVALPAVTIALLWCLPLSDDVYNVALIVSLMPGPTLSAILTHRYGGSAPYAAAAAVVTTVFSVVTIPIGCLFLR